MPRTAVGVFAVAMGVAIAATWTLDLVRGGVDLSAGVLKVREQGSGSLLWPHWLAEYGTAAALVVGGAALVADLRWGEPVVLLSLGACRPPGHHEAARVITRLQRLVMAPLAW